MPQSGRHADLKALIQNCKRPELDRLLKLTNLPRGGLKNDIQLRLLAYIEQDPSPTFISALNELRPKSNFMQCVPSIRALGPQKECLRTSWMNSSLHTAINSTANMPALTSVASVVLPNTSNVSNIACVSTCTVSKPSSNIDQLTDATSVYRLPAAPLGPLLYLAGPDGPFRLPVELTGLRFKKSPFFKQLAVVQEPQLLTPTNVAFSTGKRSYERQFTFHFTSDQAETITYHCRRGANATPQLEFGVQAVLRFARLDPDLCQQLVQAYHLLPRTTMSSNRPAGDGGSASIDLQLADDNLPIHLAMQVNDRLVPLPPILPSSRPGADGRRHARPIDVTQFLRASPAAPNCLRLAWTHDYSAFTYYVVGIYLMQKRSSVQLTGLLQANAFRTAEVMKQELIKRFEPNWQTSPRDNGDDCTDQRPQPEDELQGRPAATHEASAASREDDDDIVLPSSLPVQLLCPISKCRIEVPVRSRDCRHLQCYDATTFLVINERKPVWRCPVCNRSATYDTLFVDGLFLQVLQSDRFAALDEVIFHSNGSWSAVSRPDKIMHSSDEEDTALCPARQPVFSGAMHKPDDCDANRAGTGCDNQVAVNHTVIDLTASDEEDVAESTEPVTMATHEQTAPTSTQAESRCSSPRSTGQGIPSSDSPKLPTSTASGQVNKPCDDRPAQVSCPSAGVASQSDRLAVTKGLPIPALSTSSQRPLLAGASQAIQGPRSMGGAPRFRRWPSASFSNPLRPPKRANTVRSLASANPYPPPPVANTTHPRILSRPSPAYSTGYRTGEHSFQVNGRHPSLDELIAMCTGTGQFPVRGQSFPPAGCHPQDRYASRSDHHFSRYPHEYRDRRQPTHRPPQSFSRYHHPRGGYWPADRHKPGLIGDRSGGTRRS